MAGEQGAHVCRLEPTGKTAVVDGVRMDLLYCGGSFGCGQHHERGPHVPVPRPPLEDELLGGDDA